MIGLVVIGCAICGLVWGALRMATLVAAVAGGITAARFVTPPALSLIAPAHLDSPNARAVAALGVALVTAVLVLVAGRGLRRGLELLRLSWLDRLGGAALAGTVAVAVLAMLLALGVSGGMHLSTPWAESLARLGESWLGVQQDRSNNAAPITTPATTTNSTQHPH